LLVVDSAVLARRAWTMPFVHWSITPHITHSTMTVCQELQMGKRGEGEEKMSITNFIRGLFAICFIAATCCFCYRTSKNINKKCNIQLIYIVDRMEYLFHLNSCNKTIVITQPLVL
jgi:hypothetical protein